MTDTDSLELEFIALAVGDGVRRVRTPEGSRLFGQPIGSIITADMIKAKKLQLKAQGKVIPKGALSKKPKKISVGSGKASPESNFNANPAAKAQNQNTPVSDAPAEQKFQVKPPTIKGSQNFKVGNSQFSAPSGSKLIRPKNQPNFAYVVTPDGSVHAFNESGELDVPPYLEPVITKKFKNLKTDDSLYKVDSFDAPASLADQKPGATLSKGGNVAFKKQKSGTWLNEDIGVELSDEDLQRLYASGSFELTPSHTVEDTDFSKLTKDELQASLESMPDGKQLKFHSATLTHKNGKWNSDQTGNDISTEHLADLAEGSESLTDKLDDPKNAVQLPQDEKAKKEQDAQDPLNNPENEVTDDNSLTAKAKESKVSGADIISAKEGDVVFHDKMGALTKGKTNWENLEGKTFPGAVLASSANSGYISREPWNISQKNNKDKADSDNTLTIDGKKIDTVAKFGENDRSEDIKKDGGSTPNVFELKSTSENAKTFRDAMEKSLEGNPYSASVYVYDTDDYKGMRLFLSDDGKSGIALHDGDEIVSVFSDPKSKNKKVARHLISVAVENGGKRLDAFDTVLPEIYAKEGFLVKSRMKWNDDYAPDGWDKDTFKKFNNGEPDVVFMQHEKGMENLDYEKGSGDYVETYDDGLASTGGKAQDENDYRPEAGDPDNEESSVETTKSGFVISDDVKKALEEDKKITAIKALKDANDGMELGIAKKEIESLMVEGVQPGDALKGYMLFDLPQGAKIRTASGGEFTKNENGNWVTKNGGVFTPSSLNVNNLDGEVLENPAAKQKKIETPKDEEAEVDVVSEWVDKLNALKAGDIISNGTYEFTKNENGKFEHPDFDFEFDADDFEPDALAGKMSIVEETGSEEKAQKLTVDDLKGMKVGDVIGDGETLTWTKQEDGTFISETSGWIFKPEDFEADLSDGTLKKIEKPSSKGFTNTTQVQDAINSLEDHSGFQIKYGLKSLPEDHPLKDQETLDTEVEKAKKAYPDLPPKAALIKSLKSSLGQEDEGLADWEKELIEEDSTKKFQIGSRTPKNNATGVTGGSFSKSDIQGAISILENFHGKAFKNELNKNGNPLGKLSPNDIVGFDKDKTITKQKFIDLLKKKIGVKSAPKDESPNFNPITPSNLKLYGPGARLQVWDDDGVKGAVYTKKNNGWYRADGSQVSDTWVETLASSGNLEQLEDEDELKKDSKFDNASLDISETPEVGKVVPADDAMTALVNAPDGTIISRPHGSDANFSVRYTKKNGKWFRDNSTVPLPSNSDILYAHSVSGSLKWDTHGDAPKVGDIVTVDQADRLPIGAVIQANAGTIWTKVGDDKWTATASNGVTDEDTYPASVMHPMLKAGNGTLKSLPAKNSGSKEEPKIGDPINLEQAENLPVGSRISTPSGDTWTKVGEDSWKFTSSTGVESTNTHSTQGLEEFLNSGNAKLKSLPNNKKENQDNSSNDQPAGAITGDPESVLNAAKPGSVIIITDTGYKYTKLENGEWESQTHPGITKNSNTGLFYSTAMSGKLHWASEGESSESPSLKVGDQVKTLGALNDLPLGSRLSSTPTRQVYTKIPEGWKDLSTGVTLTSKNLLPAAEAGYLEYLGSSDTSLNVGDPIPDIDTFENLPTGARVKYQSLSSPGDATFYKKTGTGQWINVDGTGSGTLEDNNFHASIGVGNLYFDGNSKDATADGQPATDDSLDAIIGTHSELLKNLDKEVSVLPESERGEIGDGLIIVNTEQGPKMTWGKFGGGGIATVATDENGVKKVLIGKRGDRDEWYLPGGAIDENETHLQGALREFTEEIEDGQSILDNIKITKGYHDVAGKIEGTDKDWMYFTGVATLPSTMDIKAPDSTEPWELKEYKWFSAEELKDLDNSGKLHPALANGGLAKKVGFEPETGDDIHNDILSLINAPDDLSEVRYDISNWNKVGGSQGGSNPGGVYEDPLGNKYYVKSNSSEKSTHNEIVAAALYGAAGVHSNEVFLVEKDGQKMVASPWIENNKDKMGDIIKGGKSDPEFVKKIQEDFAIDAWLDNYDVLGIGPWNLVEDENGNPLRIDPGGSMMYRATGSEKTWWDENPTAIDDMRVGSSQSSAYSHLPKIFGSMTEDDVKESAKKLLNITPKQISAIVKSSGFDDETKDKLYSTLVARRQSILERFGLADPDGTVYSSKSGLDITPEVYDKIFKGKNADAIQDFQIQHGLTKEESKAELMEFALEVANGGKSNVAQFKKPSASQKMHGTPAFSKGTTVKVKGLNQQFDVILSTNEGASGIVNGKHQVFLNDELTDDLDADFSAQYAFTSNGETFKKAEAVKVVDPKNPAQKIDAFVMESDWSSGIVKVMTGSDTNGVQTLQVDKGHISKMPATAPEDVTLPEGYFPPKPGHKPFMKHKYSDFYAFTDENNFVHIYSGGGSVWDGAEKSAYEEPGDWTPWNGTDTPSVGTSAVSSTSEVDGPKDSQGNILSKNDSVTIVKYNKGGFSNQAKIVSIDTEKGTVRVRRLDENGVPLTDANGKPVYASMSLTSLKKNTSSNNETGLPTGITMSEGDKTHALYGKPAPQPPQALSVGSFGSVVQDEWFSKAEEAYKAYRAKKNLGAKDLKSSSTAWSPIEKAMQGDQASLDAIKAKGYLDEDPALYEELQKGIDANKAKYADVISAHEKAVEAYQQQKSAWMTANGVASYTPLRHEDAIGRSDQESVEWAVKKYTPFLNTLKSKNLFKGISRQKGSSSWQSVIRKLPAVLGLRREDVANAPDVTEDSMKTWDNIHDALEEVGPIGEDIRSIRTISLDRLVGPDGNPLTKMSDLTNIIGSIQKDHGAMEVTAGASLDHGGSPSFTGYEVVMDLAIPKEVKGMYTALDGAKGMWDNFVGYGGELEPASNERGMILEPGLAMYISGVEQKYVPKMGMRWVVKASIIPREVLPYMNNFEGDPMSHNILIPGKDTTTGIPNVTKTPDVPKVDTPEAPKTGFVKNLNKEQIDALPVGTHMDEVSDVSGQVQTSWEKKESGNWVNGQGASLTSDNLSGFAFKVTYNPNDSNVPTPKKPMGYQWSEAELDNAEVGDVVIDADGDTWQKTPWGEWKLIIQVSEDNDLSVGDLRSSYSIAFYM